MTTKSGKRRGVEPESGPEKNSWSVRRRRESSKKMWTRKEDPRGSEGESIERVDQRRRELIRQEKRGGANQAREEELSESVGHNRREPSRAEEEGTQSG